MTLDHAFSVDGQHRLTETQRVVYLAQPEPGAARPKGKPAPEAAFSEAVTPDSVHLFRYSALIFYGHRIHYDAEYTKAVGGYPPALWCTGP